MITLSKMYNSIDYALVAIIGTIVGFLGIIIKFFVSEIRDARKENNALTTQFIELTKQDIETRVKLNTAVEANTQATNSSIDIQKKSNDNMTVLIMKVLNNDKKKHKLLT